MTSDSYCVLPFIHLESRADGLVSPCCLNQQFYTRDDNSLFTLSSDTLSEVWNSNSIKQLRESMVNGEKPSGCRVCWEEELCGKESKRQRENKRWGVHTTPELKFLDVKLGNTCNLKCRTCTATSSSKWIRETIDLGLGGFLQNYSNLSSDGNYRKVLQWPLYNSEFWNDLETLLPQIELFEIYGGEPLINEQHYSLLRKSISAGYSKKQRIHYNTNGTVFPEFAMNEIWNEFMRVDFMFSIDGVGKQFEYMRHPASWDKVSENLQRFLERYGPNDVQICLTISSLNIYYVPEYLEVFNSLGIGVYLNLVHVPDVLSAKNLPMEIKEHVITKLQKNQSLHEQLPSLVEFLKIDNPSDYLSMMRKIKLHDQYRNENYFDIFPEFGNILLSYREANLI